GTHIGLARAGMMSYISVMLTPLALFAVTWAWSGDWMLDRPGYGRWLRLAGLVAVTSGLLFTAYIGERAWGIPEISAAESVNVARYERSPVAPSSGENAAPIYEEAGRLFKPFK